MSEVREELADFKSGALTRLEGIERDLDGLPRDVVNELQRKRTPQADVYVNKHPTARIPRDRLDHLISESERTPKAEYSVQPTLHSRKR
jgi:hypothetical protein